MALATAATGRAHGSPRGHRPARRPAPHPAPRPVPPMMSSTERSWSLRAGDLEQLLELHREHRIARDAELALEVQLHAGVGVAQHRLEVVVGDLDGALCLA